MEKRNKLLFRIMRFGCIHLMLLALATNMYAMDVVGQQVLDQKISVDLQDVDLEFDEVIDPKETRKWITTALQTISQDTDQKENRIIDTW